MLKIWYYGGTDYMEDAPSYFDNVYEDEWIEDDFVKRNDQGRRQINSDQCACD